MSRLPPFLQVILAGILASLITSLIFLGFDLGGVFRAVGIPMSTPPDILSWMGGRLIWGGFLPLLLLVPALDNWLLWQKGLLIGFLPAAYLFLYQYPSQDLGFFGLELGYAVPTVALFFSLLWGAMTGWLLPKIGFPDIAAEEDETL